MVVQVAAVAASTVVVAVDVGKTEFGFSVTDAARTVLLKPRTGCPMTGPSLARVVAEIVAVLSMDAVVRVGIEAAGHYHRPLLDARWPVGWEVLELNPSHVTEQRRVLGKRTIKTDVIDLQAMTELLLAGRGHPIRDRSLVLGELTAWSAHRTGRVSLRTATRKSAARPPRSVLSRSDLGAARCAGYQGRPAGRRGVRRSGPARRAGQQPVPLHNSGRQCQAHGTKDPDQTPRPLWQTPQASCRY